MFSNLTNSASLCFQIFKIFYHIPPKFLDPKASFILKMAFLRSTQNIFPPFPSFPLTFFAHPFSINPFPSYICLLHRLSFYLSIPPITSSRIEGRPLTVHFHSILRSNVLSFICLSFQSFPPKIDQIQPIP